MSRYNIDFKSNSTSKFTFNTIPNLFNDVIYLPLRFIISEGENEQTLPPNLHPIQCLCALYFVYRFCTFSPRNIHQKLDDKNFGRKSQIACHVFKVETYSIRHQQDGLRALDVQSYQQTTTANNKTFASMRYSRFIDTKRTPN